MGLFVSTTGTTVDISELGISIAHPTVDRELDTQFSAQEIEHADSLTSAITSGTLIWRKTAMGVNELPTDYDPDYLLVYDINVGGKREDRAVTFGDTLRAKGGRVLGSDFSGSPKRAAVVFSKPFPDTNYSVVINGQMDGRAWLAESIAANGFTINAQASATIIGLVFWTAEYIGESN